MAAHPVLDNLAPLDLVEAALSKDQRGFLTLYGDTQLLVVKVGDADAELAAGLGATAVRGSAGLPVKPISSSMEFHTQIQPVGPGAAQKRTVDPKELARRLDLGSHFVVPLRKRPGAEATYADRISVGRARNKDIVLRHGSVSKFHGWFEVDELGAFHLTDAGSSNGTRVNGVVLEARKRASLDPGDVLRFGAIEATIWSPRMLWEAIRGSAMARS